MSPVNLLEIDIDLIDPSPYQHRRKFADDKLSELSKSIERDGLIEPVVVRQPNGNGRFELIAGERRLRACKLVNLPTILSRLVSANDIQARRMCAAENLQREDLSAIEEVEAIIEMVDAELIEDEEYRRFGEMPKDRVRWLLGKINSDYNNRTDHFMHKFMHKINIIFSNLPTPINWRSFYNNDLPLIVNIEDDVKDFAAEHKLNKSQTKAAQKLKDASQEKFEEVRSKTTIKLSLFSNEEVEFSDLSAREIESMANAAKGGFTHVSMNSGDNEWYTPKDYIQAAKNVMGAIDLDPASSEAANEVIGAARYYTAHQNGLSKQWVGRVWMNPPYARALVDDFISKLLLHFSSGEIVEAMVLVNNATETNWFQSASALASALCLPEGRVQFWHPYKVSSTPLQGQAILYFGDKTDLFREEFNKFGVVWIR